MNQREALMRLGASTAAAIANVLETHCPDGIERGEVTVLAEHTSPFSSVPMPAVAASVAYVDGATGANIFMMTLAGARELAAAMMGQDSPETTEDELTELELSAVAEAANQMLAAAAGAISVVLGEEIEIDPPKTGVIATSDEAVQRFGGSAHTTSCTFTVRGESCRLIQFVPATFIARMTVALDDIAAVEALADGQAVGGGDEPESIGLVDALRNINVRVWAELGRANVAIGRAANLPSGAVVELDRGADDPVELFVNGLRFGEGELVVTEDGEWAVRLLNLNRIGADTKQMKGVPA